MNECIGLIKRCAMLLTAVFMSVASAQAAEVYWDNGGIGQDWNTVSNWVGDVAPVEDDRAFVNLAGADKAIYSSGTSPNYAAIRIETGEVEITGGTLYAYNRTKVACEVGSGAGGVGTVNQGGGYAKFCMLRVGRYAGSTGFYTLSGGDLIINRDTYDSIRIGDVGTGTFVISGGSLSTDGLVVLGNDGGTGLFSVVGSAATSISIGGEGGTGTGTDDGKWQQNAGSTLRVGIDAGGITKILVVDAGDDESENNGNVVFANGALLDVGFTNGFTATEGSWDIMQWDGVLIDSGLQFAGSVTDPLWNFQFVDTGGTNGVDTLRLIYGDVTPVETTNGTPHAWLDIFYPGLESPEEYQAADDSDSDGDTMVTWKEYTAGTIPTNAASLLKVNSTEIADTNCILSWQSVTGKYYSVMAETNLVASSNGWKTVANNIQGLETETSFTTTVSYAAAAFHKVGIEKREIYLLIGQSNMAGRGPIEAEDEGVIEGCELFNSIEEWEPATNPLNRYSTVRKDISMQKLGPGYGFAQRLREVQPDIHLGLVVNARGGTSINEWAKGTAYYNAAVSRAQAAQADGGRLAGILWHQGESNSSQTNTYMGKLVTLIEDLRADLGDPDLPFVAGQLERDDTTPEVKERPLNDYIILLPTMLPNTAVATTEGLITMDGTHFDSASQRELGRRYADALLSLE